MARSDDNGTGTTEPETGVRPYVVLEETDLLHLVLETLAGAGFDDAEENLPEAMLDALRGKQVYDKLLTPDARNTEHAFRQVAKEIYGDAEGMEIALVAVAAKMWKVEPVTIQTKQTVTIGSSGG